MRCPCPPIGIKGPHNNNLLSCTSSGLLGGNGEMTCELPVRNVFALENAICENRAIPDVECKLTIS